MFRGRAPGWSRLPTIRQSLLAVIEASIGDYY
jgi:hypothetical protein